MMLRYFGIALFAVIAVSVQTSAETQYDQTLTAIYGSSGNGPNYWTTGTSGGVTLALRARVRFNANNQPEGEVTTGGTGVYSMPAGHPTPGWTWPGYSNSPFTQRWNFDWSIDAGEGKVVGDYDYRLDLDLDGGKYTDNFAGWPLMDPTTHPNGFLDHSFGPSTAAGPCCTGTEATDVSSYNNLLASQRVAQNSWNYAFFCHVPGNIGTFAYSGQFGNAAGLPCPALTETGPGQSYKVRLTALEKGTTQVVAQVTMDVVTGDGPQCEQEACDKTESYNSSPVGASSNTALSASTGQVSGNHVKLCWTAQE